MSAIGAQVRLIRAFPRQFLRLLAPWPFVMVSAVRRGHQGWSVLGVSRRTRLWRCAGGFAVTTTTMPDEQGKPGASRGRKATGPNQRSAGLPTEKRITMRTSTKMLGVIAIGGVIATSGMAFTAGGVTAPASAFVGGSVDQSVTGAALSSVVYDTDTAANKITSVTLTFSDSAADAKTPTIAFSGAAINGSYTCAAVEAAGHTSLCSAAPTKADNKVTSLNITVA
jgi:hypothetical protein